MGSFFGLILRGLEAKIRFMEKLGRRFNSPTFGQMDWDEVLFKIVGFMGHDKEAEYEVIIGSDSLRNNGGADFVSAVIVHKVRGGAIYFWERVREEKIFNLKQRIWQEATMSLALASKLVDDFSAMGLFGLNLEIHVDVGPNGPTRELIAEITGMISASGFKVATKPSSWGASHVADRHV